MNFASVSCCSLLAGRPASVWLLDERCVLRDSGRAATAPKQPLVGRVLGQLLPGDPVVFLLRSFLVEPFKIPSSSMMPTLLVGDFILVNKFTYGMRLPVVNKKIVDVARPAARRRDGVPLSRGPVARLHQARGRPAGRPHRVPQQAADDQRPAGAGASRSTTTCRRSACSSRKRFVETLNGAEHADPDRGRRAGRR